MTGERFGDSPTQRDSPQRDGSVTEGLSLGC